VPGRAGRAGQERKKQRRARRAGDQIEGALDLSTTLGTGVRGALRDAELQTDKTQRTIHPYWPPVVGDGQARSRRAPPQSGAHASPYSSNPG
jgi:hypothetical protein